MHFELLKVCSLAVTVRWSAQLRDWPLVRRGSSAPEHQETSNANDFAQQNNSGGAKRSERSARRGVRESSRELLRNAQHQQIDHRRSLKPRTDNLAALYAGG